MPLTAETLDLFPLSDQDQAVCSTLIQELEVAPETAFALTDSLLQSNNEELIKITIFDLCSNDNTLPLGGILQTTVEHLSETLSGQRLCACLILRLMTPSSTLSWKDDILGKAKKQGISLYPAFFSISDLEKLSFKHYQAIHHSLNSPINHLPVSGSTFPMGMQIQVALGSLPGTSRGDWSALTQDQQSLALASMMDLITKNLDESATVLAAGPVSAMIRQADAIGCPIALRTLVQSLKDRYQLSVNELAVSCSLHQEDVFPGPFWRIAVRQKDTGLLLGGFDWPLSGMDSERVFYEGLIEELSHQGIDECYHVDGEFGMHECTTCLEPLYPVPSYKPWRDAALAEKRNPNGEHRH